MVRYPGICVQAIRSLAANYLYDWDQPFFGLQEGGEADGVAAAQHKAPALQSRASSGALHGWEAAARAWKPVDTDAALVTPAGSPKNLVQRHNAVVLLLEATQAQVPRLTPACTLERMLPRSLCRRKAVWPEMKSCSACT